MGVGSPGVTVNGIVDERTANICRRLHLRVLGQVNLQQVSKTEREIGIPHSQ